MKKATKPFTKNLCQPYDPGEEYDIFFQQQFPEGYLLSIRPLSLDDIDIVYQWLYKIAGRPAWENSGAKEGMASTYIDIMESSFAQTFLVLLDNIPVCVCEVLKLFSDDKKSNFSIQLFTNTEIDTYTNAIKNIESFCIGFIKSFQEVGIITTTIN